MPDEWHETGALRADGHVARVPRAGARGLESGQFRQGVEEVHGLYQGFCVVPGHVEQLVHLLPMQTTHTLTA